MKDQEKKKAISRLRNRLIEMDTMLNKLDYLEQQCVTHFNMSINEYDDTDYFETQRILKAEPTQSLDDVSGGVGSL